MLITNLTVKNFRGVKSVTMSGVPRVAALFGRNGAGKSSILAAIQQVFFGQCYDQAGGRIKNPELVGDDGKQAEIQIGLTHGTDAYDIRYTLNSQGKTTFTVKRNGQPLGGGTDTRTVFWRSLGIDVARAECAAYPRQTVLGPELPRLIAALGGGVTPEAVYALCGEHEAFVKDLARVNAISLASLDDLDAIGKACADMQTQLNRTLKADQGALDKLSNTSAPLNGRKQPMTAADMPGVDKLITDLNAKRDALIAERGAASVANPPADIEALRDAVASAEFEERQTSTALECAIAALNASHAALRAQNGKCKDAQSRIATQEADHTRLKSQRNALDDVQACPTCGRAYDADDVERAKSDVETQINAIEAYIAQVLDEMQESESSLADARATYDKAQADHREADNAARIASAALSTARAELEVASRQAQCRSRETIEADLNKVQDRIARGLEAKEQLQRHVQAEELRESIERNGSMLVKAKWGLEAFRAGAIRNKLAGSGIDEFLRSVNAVLDKFGRSLSVHTLGKDMTVLLNGIPVSQVSDGELVMVCAAVTKAFSDSGAVALLDKMDNLDSRAKPVACSLEILNHPGSVWIAGAWSLGDDPAPETLTTIGRVVGGAAYWVQNGGVR